MEPIIVMLKNDFIVSLSKILTVFPALNFINCCRYRSPVIVSLDFSSSWYTVHLLSHQTHSKAFFPNTLPTDCDVGSWLGLPMIFCALGCRNRFTFYHLSQLDAKPLFYCPASKILQIFFVFQCFFLSINFPFF